jgi:pyridoxal phosphate enzyme (YggS family)
MNFCETAYRSVSARIAAAEQAAGRPGSVALLAVSKTQSASAVRALAALGQKRFGENYVQEALAKQADLADLALEWHLIGPLQSNKCRDVAEHFDWLQSLDRARLIEPLVRWRPTHRPPLNVLIQVNIDDESGKSGCAPSAIAALATDITTQPRLRLRGLMAIPRAGVDAVQQRETFRHMRRLFETLRDAYAGVDTLSIGMSGDFELAIAQGASMVRIGSALFGARV